MVSYSPAANRAIAPEPPRLVWWQRSIALILGFGAITLLVVASQLTPSSSGFGTHRQLGLAECTMVQLAGIRCPACGMTTSWAYATRGNLVAAARTNSGGLTLALAAMIGGPWFAVSGLIGRWWLVEFRDGPAVAVCVFVVVITLIDWGVRLSMAS